MGQLARFEVLRNLRMAGARLRGTFNHACTRMLDPLGARFHRRPRRSFYGVAMIPNFGDRTFHYCFYGTYGRALSDRLAAIGEDFAFLDIGANQGLYSLIAAANPHCRAVLAVEPVRGTFAMLEANLRAVAAPCRCTAINAALSDRSGTAHIALKQRHSGAATLCHRVKFAACGQETIRLLNMAELDAMLPPGLPIWVKVDVEGHEEVVIAELLKSAHRERIAAIFYEMDERWCDPATVRRQLASAGFGAFQRFGNGRHYDMLAERKPGARQPR